MGNWQRLQVWLWPFYLAPLDLVKTWQLKKFFIKFPTVTLTLINPLLKRRVCNEKRYIYLELNNVSLRKVVDFCYSNTAYSSAGTNDCYYCRIIDYIKDEFRRRRISDPGYCVILHEGKRECKYFHSCSSNDNLHYDLMFLDWTYKFSRRNVLYC